MARIRAFGWLRMRALLIGDVLPPMACVRLSLDCGSLCEPTLGMTEGGRSRSMCACAAGRCDPIWDGVVGEYE